MPESEMTEDEHLARGLTSLKRSAIYDEITEERRQQLAKWGPQSWPDGTDSRNVVLADAARALCNAAYADGALTWLHILKEEFYEASAEIGWAKIRQELIQTIAVAVAWIEDGDEKQAAEAEGEARELMVRHQILTREEADVLTQVSKCDGTDHDSWDCAANRDPGASGQNSAGAST